MFLIQFKICPVVFLLTVPLGFFCCGPSVRVGVSFVAITKTCLFKYTENFTTKNEIFLIKSLIFFILEPPGRSGSNECRQSMF